MAKLIIVEGPDNSGKTTLIQKLSSFEQYELIKFPKKNLKNECFTIETLNEIQCFETMLNYLDSNKTYILDRGYLSNMVYESSRGFDVQRHFDAFERLIENHSVQIIPTTRNRLSQGFKDDLISLSSKQFNYIIDRFEEIYEIYNLSPVKLLEHDFENNVIFAHELGPDYGLQRPTLHH